MRAGSRQLPWFPVVILAALVVTAILAPYLSPHSPTDGNISRKLIPPVWTEGGDWTTRWGATASGGTC
jgi:peptide/nickel transport system permease protein